MDVIQSLQTAGALRDRSSVQSAACGSPWWRLWGSQTSEATIERAMAFYAAVGKKPVRLYKSLPGHVANRFQAALYKEAAYLVQQGVLSVADADVAVCYGPGIRWGVMGPSLQWHVGGGQGGIQHFMEHLMDPLAAMMKTLGTPRSPRN